MSNKGSFNPLSEAAPLSGQALLPHAKIALYGYSESGKTFAATAAFPELFDVKEEEILYLNMDSGTMTLKAHGRRCQVINVLSNGQPHPQYETPADHLEAIHRHLVTGDHNFKTVILDSMTSMQKGDLDAIAEKTMEKGSGGAAVRIHGVHTKQQADYGISTDKINYLMRAFRDLPMNVVFIFGAREEKLTSGKTVIVPDLTPALRHTIKPMVDVMGYMYPVAGKTTGEDGVEQSITTYYTLFDDVAHPGHILKDRSTTLKPFQANVTVPHMLRAMQDKIAREHTSQA